MNWIIIIIIIIIVVIIIIISVLRGSHEFEQAGQLVSSQAPETRTAVPDSLEDRSPICVL